MTVDMVITNCRVVTHDGTYNAGVAIDEGKIVAVSGDTLLPKADKTIDAKGNYLLPGIIDRHAHFGYPHPFEEDVPDSAASAFGGITTIGNVMGMAGTTTFTSYTPKLEHWSKYWEGHAFTDVFFFPVITNELQVTEIPEYARRFGIMLYKINLGYKGEDALRHISFAAAGEKNLQASIAIDDGLIYLAMCNIASFGGALEIHPENADIIRVLRKKLMAEGKDGLAAWADSRPGFAEALDIEKICHLSKVTDCPVVHAHVASKEAVEAVFKAKSQGVRIVGQACVIWLTLTKDINVPNPVLFKVTPALKSQEDVERMWRAIREGTIQCVGTDMCTTTKEMKLTKYDGKRAETVWDGFYTPGGGMFNEIFLPLMVTEGVLKGRITIEKLVEVCCYNNAVYSGLHPQKGEIRVGSDADLTIVDLKKSRKITPETVHSREFFNIYHEGWELKGWPTLTMLRGNTIIENDQLVAKPGSGRYLRQNPPPI